MKIVNNPSFYQDNDRCLDEIDGTGCDNSDETNLNGNCDTTGFNPLEGADSTGQTCDQCWLEFGVGTGTSHGRGGPYGDGDGSPESTN